METVEHIFGETADSMALPHKPVLYDDCMFTGGGLNPLHDKDSVGGTCLSMFEANCELEYGMGCPICEVLGSELEKDGVQLQHASKSYTDTHTHTHFFVLQCTKNEPTFHLVLQMMPWVHYELKKENKFSM